VKAPEILVAIKKNGPRVSCDFLSKPWKSQTLGTQRLSARTPSNEWAEAKIRRMVLNRMERLEMPASVRVSCDERNSWRSIRAPKDANEGATREPRK
jgi:hypothetical protein